MKNSSWKEDLTKEMASHNETWEDVEQCTLSEDELNQPFNHDYGMECGEPFTLWTKKRVYFPVSYDGAEWVSSVSRNPDREATRHIGS